MPKLPRDTSGLSDSFLWNLCFGNVCVYLWYLSERTAETTQPIFWLNLCLRDIGLVIRRWHCHSSPHAQSIWSLEYARTRVRMCAHKQPRRCALCMGVRQHANCHCCDKNKQVCGAESEGPWVMARFADNGGRVWVGDGFMCASTCLSVCLCVCVCVEEGGGGGSDWITLIHRDSLTSLSPACLKALDGAVVLSWSRGMDVCWQRTVFKGTLK